MADQTIWHGTVEESAALVNAIARNCTCEYAVMRRTVTCESHRLLLEDQRALDYLLFMRRQADKLRRGEFTH